MWIIVLRLSTTEQTILESQFLLFSFLRYLKYNVGFTLSSFLFRISAVEIYWLNIKLIDLIYFAIVVALSSWKEP